MGFDTSFHPVDTTLVQGRLLPYIAGHGSDGDLDDLIGRAVALRRVRFRAKAWALGALKAAEKLGSATATTSTTPRNCWSGRCRSACWSSPPA